MYTCALTPRNLVCTGTYPEVFAYPGFYGDVSPLTYICTVGNTGVQDHALASLKIVLLRLQSIHRHMKKFRHKLYIYSAEC